MAEEVCVLVGRAERDVDGEEESVPEGLGVGEGDRLAEDSDGDRGEGVQVPRVGV